MRSNVMADSEIGTGLLRRCERSDDAGRKKSVYPGGSTSI
ncbi:protein of unassigned function [Methylobacterium oryzae CBMB20]|uniref:Protein of unassigned function n=1 Tax=Methylobacterium oryzae CBMB20 TaxID=693986 RepID=A0A089NTG2_9HYPH|nr:protein of unassigned function [Methylobacterium oryzae CBMB20]